MTNTSFNMALTEVAAAAGVKFALGATHMQRDGLIFLTTTAAQLPELLTWLRDRQGFRHLVMISAADLLEQERFELMYLLHSYTAHEDIGVLVEINRDAPIMESVDHLWAAAGVFQRELFEMYGVRFTGSPRLEEPMMLEDWQQLPPMRRDFDTYKYSQDTFFHRDGRATIDPRQHMAEKLYPEADRVKVNVAEQRQSNQNH